MRIALVLTVSIAMSGCATQWQKYGATEADFYRDRTECQMLANAMYPPAMSSGPGYQGPAQTRCTTSYGVTNCTTTPGIYVPGVQSDMNAIARSMEVPACLRARGYSTR